MHNIELILLGKIVKAHGFNGAVVIALEGKASEDIKEMESVFVEVDGKPVPFFFEWVKDSGPESLIVKFDYYDSDSTIIEFVGCNVFTDRANLVNISDSRLPIYLAGYILKNIDGKELGEIVKVLSFPMQVMLELRSGNMDEILVPYSEELVVEVDDSKKTIRMELPEGIDSINVSP